ncbi:unnamed protein product [Sphagnum balticum]
MTFITVATNKADFIDVNSFSQTLASHIEHKRIQKGCAVDPVKRMLPFVCSDLVYVLGSLNRFKDKQGHWRMTVEVAEQKQLEHVFALVTFFDKRFPICLTYLHQHQAITLGTVLEWTPVELHKYMKNMDVTYAYNRGTGHRRLLLGAQLLVHFAQTVRLDVRAIVRPVVGAATHRSL